MNKNNTIHDFQCYEDDQISLCVKDRKINFILEYHKVVMTNINLMKWQLAIFSCCFVSGNQFFNLIKKSFARFQAVYGVDGEVWEIGG